MEETAELIHREVWSTTPEVDETIELGSQGLQFEFKEFGLETAVITESDGLASEIHTRLMQGGEINGRRFHQVYEKVLF